MSPAPEVLFADAHLLVLNKPSGMLTEGGGDRETDLEQVATQLTGKPAFACHRLDRLTSGAVLLRRGGKYKAELAALFEQRQMRKLYWAIVEGAWPAGRAKIETQVAPADAGVWANVTAGGQLAVSTFQVLGHSPSEDRTWLAVLLKTGRTHQARLHCQHAGCPIIGDPVYGSGRPAELFGLHARELRFRHPATGAEVKVAAASPAAWADALACFAA
ncbi:MAG: RluA family pseudouridine synthase [Opitutales bacterium]